MKHMLRAAFLATTCLAAASAAWGADDDLIKRGEYVTRAASCMGCHSGDPSKPYAGNLPIKTQFGTLYSPNITPDKETGIGNYTDEQFLKVIHDGIAPVTGYLYPAMPFTSYTHMTKDDALAIKEYLFSLQPIHEEKKANEMAFPFNVRTGLEAWRVAFFKAGEFQPDPNKSPEINRGAYLVEALGHCDQCHGARNAAMSIEPGKTLAGGYIDGWYAPNISGDMHAGIGGWSDDQIVAYLKTGVAPGKGVAAGPMAEVVHESLKYLTDGDIHAIVVYLKQTPAQSTAPESGGAATTASVEAGHETYLNFCASCHQVNGRGIEGQIPNIAGNGIVMSGGPEDVIRTVLAGLQSNASYAIMPALGADMSDQQIADVTNYVRSAWGNGQSANAGGGTVAKLRGMTHIDLSGDKPTCDAVPISDEAKPIQDPSGQVVPLLRQVNDDNMIQQAAPIIARAKSVAPHAAQADLLNALSNAFCTVALDTADLGTDQKRWRLQRFDQTIYGSLVGGLGKSAAAVSQAPGQSPGGKGTP